jgi:hypothetical protein
VQLDYDPELHFDVGDAAALYLTIPKADLRAGRFNRVGCATARHRQQAAAITSSAS